MYECLFFGWNATVASDMRNLFDARFNIEARYPFFDRRMVQFLMAIPEEQRWNCQWPKAVLRQAMTGILPETVRRRMDKAEFSPVIDLELRERQVDKIEKLVRESILVKLGIVDAAGLKLIFESYKRRIGGYDISKFDGDICLVGTMVSISNRQKERRNGMSTVRNQGVNLKKKNSRNQHKKPYSPPKTHGVWSGGEIDTIRIRSLRVDVGLEDGHTGWKISMARLPPSSLPACVPPSAEVDGFARGYRPRFGDYTG